MHPYTQSADDYRDATMEAESPAPRPAVSCDNTRLATGRITPFTGARTQCPTRADAFRILSTVVANAVAMLDNTIAELMHAREAACRGDVLGWPNLGDVTACWLQYKLGVCIDDIAAWTAAPSANKSVAEVIRRLVGPRNLIAANAITYVCEAACDAGTNAWVVVRTPAGECIRTPERTIHLCPPFWDPAHAPYREQTIIHETVHLTHCAGGVEDAARAASIGSPECLAQFVVATNGKKLDPGFVSRCGFTNRCGPIPQGLIQRGCGGRPAPPVSPDAGKRRPAAKGLPDWKP